MLITCSTFNDEYWDAHKPDLGHENVMANYIAGRAKRVLDVGCGRGSFVEQLVGTGVQVEGIDYSPTAIERSVAPEHCKLVDITDPTPAVPSLQFDVIAAWHVLDCIPHGLVQTALRNVRSRAKRLFATVRSNPEHACYARGQAYWTRQLRLAGWRRDSVTEDELRRERNWDLIVAEHGEPLVEPEPLVSIVIPAYQAERWIGRCLDAVRAQTYPNIEAVVVEDGKEDNTEAIVSSHAEQPASGIQPPSPTIRFFTIRHSGAPAARNYGIRASAGDFIVPFDADNLMAPNYVEELIQALKASPQTSYAYAGWISSGHADKCLDVWDEMPARFDSVRTRRGMAHRSLSQPVDYDSDHDVLWCICAEHARRQTAPFSMLQRHIVARRQPLEVVEGYDDALPSYQGQEVNLRLRTQGPGVRADATWLQTVKWPPSPGSAAKHYSAASAALAVDTSQSDVVVVVTVHDPYVKYVGECLDSILAQTRPPLEVVVVDNGTCRDTMRVVVSRAKESRSIPVRYTRLTTSKVAEKRNWAAGQTKSEFILFVDGDDKLAPDYIEKMAHVMRDPRVAIAYPDIQYFGRHNVRRADTLEQFDRDSLCKANWITSCSLIRRLALQQVGGWDPAIRTLMDWHLWLRITGLGWLAAKADTTLHYRLHDQNMSLLDGDRAMSTTLAGSHARSLAVATPFAGRHWALARYFEWLETQTYPHDRIHLFFLDNSCDECFGNKLRTYLARCDYASATYHPIHVPFEERIQQAGVNREELAQTGMAHDTNRANADLDEAGRRLTQLGVACATAYNMNVVRQIVWCDDLLLVEDDVVPPLDAVEKLRLKMNQASVAAVSGVVRSRFAQKCIAYQFTRTQPLEIQHVSPSDTNHDPSIHGAGFGCLLIRAAALRQNVFRPWAESKHRYPGTDYALFRDLHLQGWTANICWDVECKHYSLNGQWL